MIFIFLSLTRVRFKESVMKMLQEMVDLNSIRVYLKCISKDYPLKGRDDHRVGRHILNKTKNRAKKCEL